MQEKGREVERAPLLPRQRRPCPKQPNPPSSVPFTRPDPENKQLWAGHGQKRLSSDPEPRWLSSCGWRGLAQGHNAGKRTPELELEPWSKAGQRTQRGGGKSPQAGQGRGGCFFFFSWLLPLLNAWSGKGDRVEKTNCSEHQLGDIFCLQCNPHNPLGRMLCPFCGCGN